MGDTVLGERLVGTFVGLLVLGARDVGVSVVGKFVGTADGDTEGLRVNSCVGDEDGTGTAPGCEVTGEDVGASTPIVPSGGHMGRGWHVNVG